MNRLEVDMAERLSLQARSLWRFSAYARYFMGGRFIVMY